MHHFQEIAQTRHPLVIPDTAEHTWQQYGPMAIRSWIGVPLLLGERLIGLLTIDHTEPNFYKADDGELVTAFADLAATSLWFSNATTVAETTRFALPCGHNHGGCEYLQ